MMSCVTNLTQLSVEDNQLTSLAGVEGLTALMELYAGQCARSAVIEPGAHALSVPWGVG